MIDYESIRLQGSGERNMVSHTVGMELGLNKCATVQGVIVCNKGASLYGIGQWRCYKKVLGN